MAGPGELERAQRMMERYGNWVMLICRGVPVLAEASGLTMLLLRPLTRR
jgi:membrane protein DedA with SNARE-associated domain